MIRTKKRVKDLAEVFTNEREVNAMLDLVDDSDKGITNKIDTKFIEPSCGNGNFLIEIFKRKLINCKTDDDILTAVGSIYGVDISDINVIEARERLQAMTDIDISDILKDNIILDNFLEPKTDRLKEILETEFDVIIGNPPYQKLDGGGAEHTASAVPLYHLFIQNSIKLNPSYLTMIVPSRWFATGRGLDKFRNFMLNSRELKIIVDFQNSQECFPNVKIGGGVNYFLWEKCYKGDCLFKSSYQNAFKEHLVDLRENNILIRDIVGLKILKKIREKESKYLIDSVSKSRPFGLRTNFKDFKKEKTNNEYLKIYGNKFIGYIDDKIEIKNKNWINKWKTLSPKTGMGIEDKPLKIMHPPKISEPGSLCTETYIVTGVFDTQKEAENFLSFYKSKFFRFLVSLSKTGQDTASKVYRFVPDLPMDKEWTDEILYKKYNLTQEEIDYIEENIKEMD